MANNCWYRLKVKGSKDNVEEFIRAMKWEGEYADGGVGRVFCCYETPRYADADEVCISAELEGDCAWSVLSSMRAENNPNNIEELSKRLSLGIEVYSEEVGMEFQEHFAVLNGEIQCDDCIDYAEVQEECIEDMDDEFWESDMVESSGVTKENYKDYLDDGYLRVGGYDSWDWEYV